MVSWLLREDPDSERGEEGQNGEGGVGEEKEKSGGEELK